MRTESGLYYGSVSKEVSDLLRQHFQALPNFKSAIIRSIDSTCEPSGIVDILRRYGIEPRVQRSGVLLSREQLYQAAAQGVFVSFDEVWLLGHDTGDSSPAAPSPMGTNLDGMFDANGALEIEMKDLGCVLALQSDCRLNYATWDAQFAQIVSSQAAM